MKNPSILFVGVFALVVISGIAYAANGRDASANTTSGSAVKNMTYGQCVSQHADIKNSCFASAKGVLDTCKAQAAKAASKKDAMKQCDQAYKKDKNQCKTLFKDSKKECAKIKHNFLETLGSSLK